MTLKIAIEKITIDWIAPQLFCILSAPILFSLFVDLDGLREEIFFYLVTTPYTRNPLLAKAPLYLYYYLFTPLN